MKIIIEVEDGMVSGVYYERTKGSRIRVFVVDLDGAKIGEGVYAEEKNMEHVSGASDLTRDALTDGVVK